MHEFLNLIGSLKFNILKTAFYKLIKIKIMSTHIIINRFCLAEVVYAPTPNNHCLLIITLGSPYTFPKYLISIYVTFTQFYEMMQVAGKPGNKVLDLVTDEINKNGDTEVTTVDIMEKASGEIYFYNLNIV